MKNNIKKLSLFLTVFSLLSYFQVAFMENLIGYIFVPIFLSMYLIMILIYAYLTKSYHSKPIETLLIFLTLNLWIIYGIVADIFFHGINSPIMILAFSFSLGLQFFKLKYNKNHN